MPSPRGRLAELEAAVEDLQPYISNTLNDRRYPVLRNKLDCAVHRLRPAGKVVAGLRVNGR